MVRGRHQLSFGANWIHTKIETVNNRPTNGQFTFNGQSTGLGLADFMLGRVSNFVQGNPVYDFDRNDYVGAYVQDEWRIRPNLTVNAGLRWEPYLAIKNSKDYVSNFDEARFDAGIRSTVYPQAPAGLLFPGDAGFPGSAAMNNKLNQFAPRAGVVWQLNEKTAIRGGWGTFYDTPHLFFNTRFANNPPWGAQITLTSPAGGFANPYLTYPGGNPFPALATGWQTQPFPTAGVYVNTPLDTQPTSLQQWNVGAQRQVADWLLTASYLGNHSSHLWRATELNYAIYSPGATTATTNARRRLVLKNPAVRGVLRHPRRARRHRPLQLQRDAALGAEAAQRRSQRAHELHALEVHDRSGDDRAHRADDHRPDQPGAGLLVLRRGPAPRRERLARGADARRSRTRALNAIFGDWQIAPLVRWQSGSHFTVTTGVDNALSGQGGQRAVQILDNVFGDGTVNNYLNRGCLHLAGSRHLQHAQAERVHRAVAVPERSGADPHVRPGGAQVPVPLGGLQRGEQGELQQPDIGAEQLQLRAHPDGRGAADHAVRVQV